MIKMINFLIVLMVIFQVASAQESEELRPNTKQSLYSDILNEARGYWVSLPDSYFQEGNSYKEYPLLIVLDGDSHFNTTSTMVRYMSSDRYRSWKAPEMIVVGIQNVDRRRDYTPEKIITVRENNSGGGEKFLQFLEKELIPYLDQNYRTTPYRILFGHSLSGLLATHSYMKEESAFHAFIAVDPSFGTWDSETMDRKLDNLTQKPFDRYIYFATANWGKRNFRNRDRHMRLFEGLKSKSTEEFHAKLEYFENESHASVPLIAFHNGISAIFEGYDISYRDVESPDHLENHFFAISERLSWEFLPPESLVNQLGYSKLRSGNAEEQAQAVEYFIMNTKYYPESQNAFSSLGEAYEVVGNSSLAIENYIKSLMLFPENEYVKNKLANLRQGKY
ncbi:alpha/beta hydrolase-fold protein [Algoriphagus sp. NF]|uniref:alpha/beta hydrolase-fold protein n=1 Tax=Algoriphagus sp. NF TaxID=2992756 RepID=UPI00237A97AE|nr:alpha/beta hydrolase-fold protein [Algoriphagus sp. NF]MDE0561263.1 alpha/beta hydrolase-fold protein [Algoriphagus sp. NF]